MFNTRFLPSLPTVEADRMVAWLYSIGFVPRRSLNDTGVTVDSLVWPEGAGRMFSDPGCPGQSVTYLTTKRVAEVLHLALIDNSAVVTELLVDGAIVISGSVRDREGNAWVFELPSPAEDS